MKTALKKAVWLVFSLWVLSVVVFFMARLAPGDPLRAYYGDSVERMSVEQKQAAESNLGLDKPLTVQYGHWLSNALQGNFGISLQYKRPAMELIGAMGLNTVILGGGAYLLTFGLALPLGIWSAVGEDSPVDRCLRRLGTLVGAIPEFWLSLAGLFLFSVCLRWLPAGGAYDLGSDWDFQNRIRHLILPMGVLVIGHVWYSAYLVRNLLLEEFRKDYVLLCRAKGMSRMRTVLRHCVRGILPAYLELMAASIPHILGGTYIVEKVFSYPGLGTLCFDSAKYHDYHLLMLLCLLTGAVLLLGTQLCRFLSSVLDQRIESGG